MKKIIALIATLFLSFSAFAIEFKTYLALDYDFCIGNTTFQYDTDQPTYLVTNRQGFDLDVAFYIFPKLGIYGNLSNNFLFYADKDFDEDATGSKLDFAFGLTYHNDINNNLEWTIGVGPHISVLSYDAPLHNKELSFSTFGIAVEGGVRLKLFKVAFLTTGLSGHYDFANIGVKINDTDMTDHYKNLTAMDVKAYLGVGAIITELF